MLLSFWCSPNIPRCGTPECLHRELVYLSSCGIAPTVSFPDNLHSKSIFRPSCKISLDKSVIYGNSCNIEDTSLSTRWSSTENGTLSQAGGKKCTPESKTKDMIQWRTSTGNILRCCGSGREVIPFLCSLCLPKASWRAGKHSDRVAGGGGEYERLQRRWEERAIGKRLHYPIGNNHFLRMTLVFCVCKMVFLKYAMK